MDKLIIQSSGSDAKLILSDPGPKNIKQEVGGFIAKLESHKVPFTECDVYGVNGQYLYDFFKAIKTSKDKVINYYSLEDNLIIDATYKNDEIELNVKLRKGPWDDDWQVEELITLDKNNYNNLLVQLATFLRLKNTI